MVGWVPIAGQNNREVVILKTADIIPENGNKFIVAADAECSTRQKIILDIDDE
ncbi:MAG TPA: hypothetical protein PKD12_20185 [Nitrospira sp.]|nr:hypothetical protein [Nitrospira sp.]